jgi:peroxiredoxin
MKTIALLFVAAMAATSSTSRATAPDFSLTSLEGRTVRLSNERGKIVLLNFWATWCGGCKVEMPWLAELDRQYRARGLEIIGVSMNDAGEDVIAKFAKSKNAGYTIAKGNDAVAKAYGGVRFLPQTFVIDRRGVIVKTLAGVPDRRELEDIVKRLLGP